MDAFKQLVESGVISEAVKTELESAFNQKIQENRDQVTAELREEFAQRYTHDKGVMVEALDKLVGERLAAELGEFVQDRKALAEAKLAYKRKMTGDSKTMESFVMSQLAKELVEFQSDRKTVAENFAKLEQFVVNALAKEIGEFAEDKKEVIETKVRLVREAKVKFAEVKKEFIKRAAETVKEAVGRQLTTELSQLKEDIESARTNNFGRRIFEAFAQEFQHSYLNEKSETSRLLQIVDKKEQEIAEAQEALNKAQAVLESKNREIRVKQDLAERTNVMSELLAPLSAEKRAVMSELLESVQTAKLATAYDKYLPAVMEGGVRKTKQVIAESAEQNQSSVTGDREVKNQPEAGFDNIVDIRKLAGLAK
jgi:hypothetical protein